MPLILSLHQITGDEEKLLMSSGFLVQEQDASPHPKVALEDRSDAASSSERARSLAKDSVDSFRSGYRGRSTSDLRA